MMILCSRGTSRNTWVRESVGSFLWYFPIAPYLTSTCPGVESDLNNIPVLGQDEGYMFKYNPLPEGVPEGTPEGKELNLTVYPESSPNKDIISF